MSLETPVAFCIFNRPQLTARVFAAIRLASPKQLLVIADGPRDDRPGEQEAVAQTREILNRIDWPCEVKTNFSSTNLGCKTRMATGLTWAFEQAEELIVLEDDCLPDPTFFSFTQSLLRRYRDTPQIMRSAVTIFNLVRPQTTAITFPAGHISGAGQVGGERGIITIRESIRGLRTRSMEVLLSRLTRRPSISIGQAFLIKSTKVRSTHGISPGLMLCGNKTAWPSCLSKTL